MIDLKKEVDSHQQAMENIMTQFTRKIIEALDKANYELYERLHEQELVDKVLACLLKNFFSR